MAANNDYMLNFGSNADKWVQTLKSELLPARREITELQSLLTSLEAQAGRVSKSITPALANQAGGGRTHSGGQIPGAERLMTNMVAASGELDHILGNLGHMVKGLADLPNKVANSMRGISGKVNALEAQLAGKGPTIIPGRGGFVSAGTAGGVSTGSFEHRIANQIRDSLRTLGNQPSLLGLNVQPSIANVSRGAMDKAGVDRIVTAIRAQTRVIASGLKIKEGSVPATPVSGKRSKGKVRETTVEESVENTETKLARVEEKMARAIALIGDSADEASQQLLASLEQERASLRAAAAQTEREQTGISRKKQRQRNQESAAAERAARETISIEERNARREAAALIASPGASDFDARLGRARTTQGGNYSREDLDKMVEAYRRVGIIVEKNSKTTKQELADRLKAANAEYRQQYPNGAETLRTQGLNVSRSTTIGEQTASMLGDLTDSTKNLKRAFDILAADAKGGGKRPQDSQRGVVESIAPAPGQPRTGHINVPPGMVKGRGERGSGLGLLYSQEDFDAALMATKANAGREMERVLQQASRPDFDPYSQRHDKAIQAGNSPEEIRFAQAARNRLRDMRLSTKALDQMGLQFIGLNESLERNTTRANDLRGRIQEQIKSGRQPDRGDQDELASVETAIRNINRELLRIPVAAKAVFKSESYMKGLEEREGLNGKGYAPGYAPGVGTRQVMDARREYYQDRDQTFSEYRDFREATGAAVVGARTGMGTRAAMRPISDITFQQGRYVPSSGSEGWNKGKQEKIDAATNKLTQAQVEYAATLRNSESTAEELRQAQENLEVAANLFANRIASVTKGNLAPSFQSLTGLDPTPDSKAARDELRRQEAREAAELNRTRKFKDTKEQAAIRAQQTLDLAQSRLAKAVDKRTKASERLAAAEAKMAEAAGTTEREHVMGSLTRIADKSGQANRDLGWLERVQAMAEDPAQRSGISLGADEMHGFGPKQSLQSVLALLARQVEKLTAQRDKLVGQNAGANQIADVEKHLADVADFQRRTQAVAARQGTGDVGTLIGRLNSELSQLKTEGQAVAKRAGVSFGDARNANSAVAAIMTAEREIETLSAEVAEAEKALGRSTRAIAKETQARDRKVAREGGGAAGGSGNNGGPGDGGGTSPGRSQGPEGPEDSILRRILAKLNEIHGTLKGGVKTTGIGGTRSTPSGLPAPRSQSFPKSEVQAVQSGDSTATLAAIKDQRRREAGVTAEQVERAHSQALKINARLESDRGKAVRTSYLEQQRLAGALALTSKATQAQVGVLARMIREGRSDAEIAHQRLTVYRALDLELAQQGVRQTGRTQAISSVFQATDPKASATKVQNVTQELRKTAFAANGFRTVDEALTQGVPTDGVFGPNSEFTRAMFGGHGFWSRVMASTGTFVVRNFTAGFVFGITNALQQVMEQAIQAEATFVRVSSALEATGKSTGSIRSDLQGIASEYGVQLNDVYEQAAGLAGLFEDSESLAAGTRIAAQLQIISGGAVSAAEATGILASTLSAFEALPGQDLTDKLLPGGLEGVQHVADVFTSIQNNLGTNIEITAEGVSRMSGLARQMSLSFEQTAVFTAQIAKQTNQTGAAAGEQFSRILSGLQTGRGRGALTDALGPGAFAQTDEGSIDYGGTLERLIGSWGSLSDAQRRNLTVSIAGARQAASFNALMNDGQRTLDALAKAQDANGDATERMDKLTATLNNQLARLGTNAQVFASNLIQTGILNFLGLMLTVTNNTLEVVNGLLNAFNKFADSNSFLAWMRDAIGLLLGAGLAFKVVQSGVAGIRGSIDAARRTEVGAAVLGTGRERDAEGRPVRRSAVGPSFGGWHEGRRSGGLIARSVGFGLDRTVGRGLDAGGQNAARGLTSLSNRLAPAGQEVSNFRSRLATFSRDLGSRTGAFGQAARGGIQQIGRGGLVSGGFTGLSERLAATAEAKRAAASEARRTYAAQTRYASIVGTGVDPDLRREQFRERLASQGLSDAQVATRTSKPDAGLFKTAQQLDRVGSAADKASRVSAKLSGALSRVGESGALADGAMIAVGLGIAAFVENMQRQARLADAARLGHDNNTEDSGKTEDQKNREKYAGPASEIFDREFALTQDTGAKDGFFSKAGWDRGFAGLGAVLSNPLSPKTALARSFGTTEDFSETFGLSEASAIASRTMGSIETLAQYPTTTSEQLRKMQDMSEVELRRMSERVNSDESLSDAQRAAGQAAIEKARVAISESVNNYSAMADGLNSAIALSAEQIQQLQQFQSVIASTDGVTAIRGLDLAPIYTDMIDDVGAQEGSNAQRMMERLASGSTDSVERATINARLLKEQVQTLYSQWQSKLHQDPEAAADIKSQLMAAMAQLAQSSNDIISSIYDNAALLSNQARDTGDLPGAIGYYIDAIDKADKQYDTQTREIRRSLRAQEALAKTITANTAELQAILGDQANTSTGILLGSPLVPREVKLPPLPEGVEYDENNPFIAGTYAKPKEDQATRKKGEKERRNKYDETTKVQFQILTELLIFQATKHITAQIAATADAGLRAGLEAQRAAIENSILTGINSGSVKNLPGIDNLTADQQGTLEGQVAQYGNLSVGAQQLADAQNGLASAQVSAAQAQQSAADQARADAAEARQNAAALRQARIGVAAAWADARGDAVASAKAQVAMARAAMAAARAELAAAATASESATARIAILNAQAQIIAANAAVQQAQTDLVQSQYDVSIALAEAAGKTVLAARRQLGAARAALASALKRSGGEATAEVNAARAEAIRADAALRDAKLQDDLDTINFNLEMGKITQSSAISALREILRTSDLTRAQRRQLLLQIKGMKDEMADSQWNFGDIKLPTPYQMRRYIEERKREFSGQVDAAARGSRTDGVALASAQGAVNNTSTTTININGADIAKVKRIIDSALGGSRTINRTTGARRR